MSNLSLFRVNGFSHNVIFDAADGRNRDGSFAPFIQLKQRFSECGFDLQTADMADGRSPTFELHQDVQRLSRSATNYLLMLEAPLLWPANAKINKPRTYRKIFTWNDDLVDGVRTIKINFPNQIRPYFGDGFASRDRLVCLIAGNKSLTARDARDLYGRRVEAIRWFERHAPQDFDLFGTDWDLAPAQPGLASRVSRKLAKALMGFGKARVHFPSYRGRIARKADVLTRTKFAICYENVTGFPGYITEKIFDCFLSGCVPVYWGAPNVTDYIPASCFLDRRQFESTAHLYDAIQTMPEARYCEMQDDIAKFMQSQAARQFGIEVFVDTIVDTIVADLAVDP